jgi:GDPmannose 4,6-dehydratase
LKEQYDEIYHLAAQSHVRVSFDNPVFTSDVTGIGTAVILESMRLLGGGKFYFAGSSEMFGSSPPPQNEQTPMIPQSPYGCSKVYGYNMTKNYREGYGLHACTGILFNHESPRRGETFVTRKISNAAARIKLGIQDNLVLGNLDAKRDWGYSPDFVKAMWMMLQADKPDDYVIATGETHTVREFLEKTFEYFDLNYKDYVKFDEKYLRPTEVDVLLGNPNKAKLILGWEPEVKFDELVEIMAKESYARNQVDPYLQTR